MDMGTVGRSHRRHHAHLKHRKEHPAPGGRSIEPAHADPVLLNSAELEQEHRSSDTLLPRQDTSDNDTPSTATPETSNTPPATSEAANDTPAESDASPSPTSNAENRPEGTNTSSPTENQDGGGEGTSTDAVQSPTPSQEPEPQPSCVPEPNTTDSSPTENVAAPSDEVQTTSFASEPAPEPTPEPTPEPITSDNLAAPTESPTPSQEWVPAESTTSPEVASTWTEQAAPTLSESPSAAAFTESTEAPSSTVTDAGVIVAGTTSSSVSLSSSAALSSVSASASGFGSSVAASGVLSSSAAASAASGSALVSAAASSAKGVSAPSLPPISSSASSSGSEHAAAGHETLTPGEKAGIAVGVLVAAGALLLALLFCIRRRRNSGIVGSSRSNPYAFSSYGAAEEKRSDLKRKGTMHSALDFSDGPLPSQRSRWRHLSSLGRPFGRSSMVSGPGMAGVGSSPARLDSTNPSFDNTRGAYPYAQSESDDEHEQHANAPPLQADDDGSHFRNTHYEEWLAYDGAISSPTSAYSPSSPGPSSPSNLPTNTSTALRAPQARRVPVPRLDDPFRSPDSPSTPPAPFKISPALDSPSARSTLGDVYNAYGGPQPVLQRLPFLRVTPPPVQARGYAQPMSATVGTVGTAS